MIEFNRLDEVTAYNDRSLKTLARAIALSEGQFSLILVRCNYASLRERMVQRLRELYPDKIQERVLPESVKTLYTTIQVELGNEQPQALMIFGLESVVAIDQVLTSTNQVREEFRKNFSFPLVLWVNDEVLQKLIQFAPDFKSWAAASIKFEISTNELIDALRQIADRMFATILDSSTGKFLQNSVINLEIGSRHRSELDSALRDLQTRGQLLEPELEASVQFVLGRDAYATDQIDVALAHYQQSLAFWQQSNHWQWQGVLLFHIGLCYSRKADLYRAESCQSWKKARHYLQQCMDVFEQAQRPDLIAKFISQLGEVLQKLGEWEDLHTLAKKSRDLHREYGSQIQLAQDYGFLAEVALKRSRWAGAKQLVQQALQILANVSGSHPQDQSLYLLLLAQSQRHLGQLQEAGYNLEKAREQSSHQQAPQLYIRILEELRSLYFEQGKYLEAFQIKQEQLSIEQQYGFRAFIGAGRLQPQRQVDRPEGTVAQEIVASGRQQDVNRLIERISGTYHKLTVIHGQSGVGKSSIVNAGLVPALKQQAIAERDALPIVLRVYTDWIRNLGKCFAEAIEKTKGTILPAPLDSVEAIIEQLRTNADRNLLTVLIFDQFEEFFFVCTDQVERRPFYEFLRDCLNIPFVKVILSLREDYLHYLLEYERLYRASSEDLPNLDLINNILDKDIRYYLGNFLPEDAKLVIQSLTERSQFYLEPALIDALVRDLAGELGEVRPIELQVVGVQLQEDEITTLKQYQDLGSNPKETLVERSLEEVIKDCGPKNERVAQFVLYSLTDEKGTRPLKTLNDLAANVAGLVADLAAAEKLNLVLEILVRSGLVVLLPEIPQRYQLVHDYLVSLVRRQNDEGWQAKYRAEKRQRELVEEAYKTLHKFVNIIFLLMAISPILVALVFVRQSAISNINAITTSSEALFTSNQGLDALEEGLRAARQLQSIGWLGIDTNTKNRVVTALQQAVYWVKERNKLNGHTDTVFSVSFSPDGQTIASASGDNTVKLWKPDGTLLLTKAPLRHNDRVIDVSFSPDGKTIASASHDKTVKLWKTDDGTLLTTLIGHTDQIWDVSFSPDGKTIASASRDKTVKLWKTADGTLLTTLIGHNDGVGRVGFNPKNGQILASASIDKAVKLWKLDGTLLKTLKGHGGAVHDVSFSSDGKTIASASADKTVKLWKHDGKLLKTLPGHENIVYQVSFSPDSKILASASGDNTVKLWKRDGELIKTLTGHTDEVYRVNFSLDGQTLASGSRDNMVNLWKRDGTLIKSFKGHRDAIIGISFSPNNQMLASASYDKTVKLWQLDNDLLTILQGHSDWVSGVSFSPDGQIVASTSRDNTVKLWKRDGTLLKTPLKHRHWVVSVDFSPDGQMLASASWDNTVKLWKYDGPLLKTLEEHQDRVSDVSFSPDGQTLASASYDKTIKLWNWDGALLKTFKGHQEGVVGVDFSPNGQMLASASDDKTVKLWRLNGTELNTLKGHGDQVYGVSFSPDGQTLASASADSTVKLWKLDGTLLNTLKHSAAVYRVRFSPNGQTLASTSEDNTVRLWKRDGTLLTTLTGHTAPVFGVSFSPDGQTLASASNDKTVILWNSINYFNNQSLDNLLVRGCDQLHDYLNTNPNGKKDRYICK